MKKIYADSPDSFRVVGFQAAIRPLVQHTLCISCNAAQGICKDIFQKISLPKSKAIAIGIYEYFGHGEHLFPPKNADVLIHLGEEMQKKQGKFIFSGL